MNNCKKTNKMCNLHDCWIKKILIFLLRKKRYFDQYVTWLGMSLHWRNVTTWPLRWCDITVTCLLRSNSVSLYKDTVAFIITITSEEMIKARLFIIHKHYLSFSSLVLYRIMIRPMVFVTITITIPLIVTITFIITSRHVLVHSF